MMGPGYGPLGYAPRLVGGFGGAGIGALMFLGFVAVVCLVVWLLYRSSKSRTPASTTTQMAPPAAPADAAMQIVRERLARGEIDADEYEKLMAMLARTT
jgi:uncharacterized membrane protein